MNWKLQIYEYILRLALGHYNNWLWLFICTEPIQQHVNCACQLPFITVIRFDSIEMHELMFMYSAKRWWHTHTRHHQVYCVFINVLCGLCRLKVSINQFKFVTLIFGRTNASFFLSFSNLFVKVNVFLCYCWFFCAQKKRFNDKRQVIFKWITKNIQYDWAVHYFYFESKRVVLQTIDDEVQCTSKIVQGMFYMLKNTLTLKSSNSNDG